MSEKRYGVKVGIRYLGKIPAVQCDILLYGSENGELLALMYGTRIAVMRTGTVFKYTNTEIYELIPENIANIELFDIKDKFWV